MLAAVWLTFVRLQDPTQPHQHQSVAQTQTYAGQLSSSSGPDQQTDQVSQWKHVDQVHEQPPTQAQAPVQTQDGVEREVGTAWSPHALVTSTAAGATLPHSHDSPAFQRPPAEGEPMNDVRLDMTSGSEPVMRLPQGQLAHPVLSNSPLLVGQAQDSPSSPAFPQKAQEGSAGLVSQASRLSTHPVGASVAEQAAEEEDSSPQGNLSAREKALRSLSSKGIQLSPSASGRASRLSHAGQGSGSVTVSKQSLGSRYMPDSERISDGQDGKSAIDHSNVGDAAEGSQGLSQRAKAVRALSLRLNMGTKLQQ